jgi:hypothetical protein
MIRLCFFGTFKGWCKDLNVAGKEPLDFITNFERELRVIANRTKQVNPTLYDSARKSNEAKKKNGNVIGSFYALYLQEYELRVVEPIIRWLIEETDVMNHPTAAGHYVGVYEYDGIKLLKANVDAYDGGAEALGAKIIRK